MRNPRCRKDTGENRAFGLLAVATLLRGKDTLPCVHRQEISLWPDCLGMCKEDEREKFLFRSPLPQVVAHTEARIPAAGQAHTGLRAEAPALLARPCGHGLRLPEHFHPLQPRTVAADDGAVVGGEVFAPLDGQGHVEGVAHGQQQGVAHGHAEGVPAVEAHQHRTGDGVAQGVAHHDGVCRTVAGRVVMRRPEPAPQANRRQQGAERPGEYDGATHRTPPSLVRVRVRGPRGSSVRCLRSPAR